jgi:hypothetical protein
MFCPACGRNNVAGTKFCVTCGTNLEIVSQALSGSKEDFFTKIDAGFDLFLGRYSEHIFKNALANVNERSLGNSWRLLGKSAVTSFVDLILFSLMWNILPFRFLMLLIATPIRMLSQRGNRQRELAAGEEQPQRLANSMSENWLLNSGESITEHTTERLAEYKEAAKTGSQEPE